MFDRFVFAKLNEEWAGDEGVTAVLAEARRVLPSIPGVRCCRIGSPADAHAGKGWDVCFVLSFASLEDIESYRVHPIHQAFLNDFLEPKVEAKRAWNFSVEEVAGE